MINAPEKITEYFMLCYVMFRFTVFFFQDVYSRFIKSLVAGAGTVSAGRRIRERKRKDNESLISDVAHFEFAQLSLSAKPSEYC